MHINYPEELIEEIRIANDVVDVVSEYVRLGKKGANFFGLCPFHREKTPSFSVSPTKQIFNCFGCGKGGNVFRFIMDIEHLDFIDALKTLADRAHIQLPESDDAGEKERAALKKEIILINTETARFYHNTLVSPDGQDGMDYLKKRNLSDNIIRKFGLGYSKQKWDALYKYLLDKKFSHESVTKSGLVLQNNAGQYYDRFRGRVMFPIFDIRGSIIGFGGRVMDDSMPKYMNSPETVVYNKGKSLYALNFAKNSGLKRLIIVEGYMDVISLHQNGIINTTASLGTALTESQGRILKKYAEEIVISYDSDTAGQAATMRGLDLLNDLGCNVKVLIIPKGKDPDEFIKQNGADAFNKLVQSSLSLVEYKIRVLKSQIDTSTTDGKIDFLNKAADMLAKINNNVEREMYIKKIAKEYEVSEGAVLGEVYKKVKPITNLRTVSAQVANIQGVQGSIKKEINANEDLDSKLKYYERLFLAILCDSNGVFKNVSDKIAVEDFMDDGNRQIAEMVFNKLKTNKGVVPGEVMNILDEAVSSDFARVITKDCHFGDMQEAAKAAADSIRNIKTLKSEKREREILFMIKNREHLNLGEGDVGKLKIEWNSLIQERKKF